MKNVDYTLYLVTDRDVLKGRDLIKCVEESHFRWSNFSSIKRKECYF